MTNLGKEGDDRVFGGPDLVADIFRQGVAISIELTCGQDKIDKDRPARSFKTGTSGC